jgi:TRAP-type C4-dicarboxylate transport system substrate-binding protein
MTKMRKMAWNSLLTCVGLLLAGFLPFVAAPAQAEKITLKIASGHSPSWHFVDLAKNYFIPEVKKRVKERTSHEIEFVEGWSGAMAQATEVFEAVQSGIIDVGVFCICHEGQKLALHNFPYYLPFGPVDPEISLKATRQVYDANPELNQVFQRYGQRVLGLITFEPYDIVSRFPISKASEVKGRKIGAAGPNAFWVESAGALPVSVGGPDMYTSFQTGLIDSMLIFLSVMDSLKLFEVAPNFIKVDFGSMVVLPITVSNRRFDRLPKEVADIMVEVGRETEIRSGPYTRDLVAKTMKMVGSRGVNIVNVSEAERKAWAELLADSPGKIGKRFEDETKLPVRKVMKAYVAATEAAGHKWPLKYQLD